MSVDRLESVLQQFDTEYLILSYEHLFISSTLREEILLLQNKKDNRLLAEIAAEARQFNLLEVAPDRYFEHYSGGQRAILACLLIITLLRWQNMHGIKILLNNVLESISAANRKLLMAKFGRIKNTNNIRVFKMVRAQIEELDLSNGSNQRPI